VLWVADYFPLFRVKKTQLFDRREFCVFSEKEGNGQGLAVASRPTARRGFFGSFF
jgi:hypothetical protein